MTRAVVAYLALGTNVGDRAVNLARALELLRATEGLSIETVASLYETEPVGVRDQPWFLNTAARARTSLSPRALLTAVKRVESEVGRTPTYRWGPREIDVDILLYDNLTLSEPDLQIPHPRMSQRLFVLLPLRDVAPGYRDASGTPIDELIDRLRGTAEVRPYSG